MAKIGPDDWLEAERSERQRSKAGLAGMAAAGPWTTVPAIASLPIMAVAGEGDYIIPVLGLMWGALMAVAIRVRRRSEAGSIRRSCATWVASYSAVLTVMMAGLTIVYASAGVW